ncbi:ABC transporter ATP-binding protein [Maribrevibacterium harenarium]|uniref:ABC transporter ATP-binding protein n=1 Tax=Maribrevibacterium harenarium TaxID=2589817 RepID=A0A501X4E6_9GAMM|nr:ATP-binding cassette domain-containing protein [Maribrevibacterium harenarium]TPE55344.1 ABC transporter ATP-binding protein [Maribrevibacterium harenarium]
MIKLDNICVQFGGVKALDNINAEFSQPISGIIGPNGAGKTTTMNSVSGFLDYQGTISWNGEVIDGLNPFKRTRWGLRRSFQKEQIADDLTVIDNLKALIDNLGIKGSQRKQDLEWAIESMGISALAYREAATLNTYERRLTDLARCILGNPKIVMLDEPCGGLQQDETERLGDLILKIPQLTRANTLVIDHDVDLIARICAETLVLDFGKPIAFGKTREVLANPKVKAAYLGVEEVA